MGSIIANGADPDEMPLVREHLTWVYSAWKRSIYGMLEIKGLSLTAYNVKCDFKYPISFEESMKNINTISLYAEKF